jgi:hypothetical protein
VAAELLSAGPLGDPAVLLVGPACGLLALEELDEPHAASVMVAAKERAAAPARRRDRGIMTAP